MSWITAQVIKIIIYTVIHKKFSMERLYGAGGMPSSHAALVCSTCVATLRQCGIESPIFALSLIFAGVVMYDAMGVRRAAGEQAKVINKMLIVPSKEKASENQVEKVDFFGSDSLKELLGHTPMEVLGGATLGVIFAILVNPY